MDAHWERSHNHEEQAKVVQGTEACSSCWEVFPVASLDLDEEGYICPSCRIDRETAPRARASLLFGFFRGPVVMAPAFVAAIAIQMHLYFGAGDTVDGMTKSGVAILLLLLLLMGWGAGGILEGIQTLWFSQKRIKMLEIGNQRSWRLLAFSSGMATMFMGWICLVVAIRACLPI